MIPSNIMSPSLCLCSSPKSVAMPLETLVEAKEQPLVDTYIIYHNWHIWKQISSATTYVCRLYLYSTCSFASTICVQICVRICICKQICSTICIALFVVWCSVKSPPPHMVELTNGVGASPKTLVSSYLMVNLKY